MRRSSRVLMVGAASELNGMRRPVARLGVGEKQGLGAPEQAAPVARELPAPNGELLSAQPAGARDAVFDILPGHIGTLRS